jgi:hypothetical protein
MDSIVNNPHLKRRRKMKAAIAAQEAKVKATHSRVSTEYSGRFRTRAAIQRAAEEKNEKRST